MKQREPLDSRRFFLAGYLSGLPQFSDKHPESMLPLADNIIRYLAELDVESPYDSDGDESRGAPGDT